MISGEELKVFCKMDDVDDDIQIYHIESMQLKKIDNFENGEKL